MISSTIPSTRQYHATSSAYVLPNDATEHERLDAQAAAIVEMVGGRPFLTSLYNASDVAKAVDIGCGTGVATVQLASLLPSATVYGLDISPVPAGVQSITPPNVRWTQGDILHVGRGSNEHVETGCDQGSVQDIFRPASLDYIFGRMLFLGINDWPKYFSVAAHAMRPGAVMEHQDLDWKFYRVGTYECLSDGWEWHREIVAAARESGLSTTAGSAAPALMKKEGLEVISSRVFEFSFVPSIRTPNSQAMGRYVQAKLVPQYPELVRKMLASQVSPERLEKLVKDCLRDIGSEEGLHQKYTVTIAQKL